MLLPLGNKPVRRARDVKYQRWNAIRVSWMVILGLAYTIAINEKPALTGAAILIALGLGFGGFGLFDLFWSRFIGPVEQIFLDKKWLLPTRLFWFLGGAALVWRGAVML